jgi:hypothetical protein
MIPNPRRVPECKSRDQHEWQVVRVEGWAEFSVCLKCGRSRRMDLRPKGLRECLICKAPLPKRARQWCGGLDCDCWRPWAAWASPWAWRDYIWWRDKAACRNCGLTGPEARLEAHHIQPVAQGGIECDPDNGALLCHECHREEHRRLRAR